MSESKSAASSSDDIQARIEAARARRQQLEDERAKREEQRALTEQLEAEERGVRNAEAVAKAEAEHGPVGKAIAVVDTSAGVVIVKRPNHVAFRKFQDAGAKEDGLSVDLCEQLVRPCVVYPDRTTFDKWATEEAAIILRCANACAGLHGARAEKAAGKY